MRRRIVTLVFATSLIFQFQHVTDAKGHLGSGELTNLDRAIVFAVHLEIRANGFEHRSDVCVGFGSGLKVDEKEILSELNREKPIVHSNGWCNHGPRGLVIAINSPATEPHPGVYELIVEAGDNRPILQRGEHFATLLRRGTYMIKCKEGAEPALVLYQGAEPAGPSPN
jgi:hypothetical protein